MIVTVQDILNQAVEYRLDSQHQEALNTLNKIPAAQKNNIHIMLEAFKVMILLQNKEQTKILYSILSQYPDTDQFWSLELLLRANQVLDSSILEEIKQRALQPNTRWAKHFVETQEELTYEPQIQNFSINCRNGATYYKYSLTCSDCEHTNKTEVFSTLFIERLVTCSNCLAQSILATSHILDYLKENGSHMLSSELLKIDDQMFALQEQLGHYDDENVPLLCRSLNQQLASRITEMTAKRLWDKS